MAKKKFEAFKDVDGVFRVKDTNGESVKKNGIVMGFSRMSSAEQEAAFRNSTLAVVPKKMDLGKIAEFEDLENDVNA